MTILHLGVIDIPYADQQVKHKGGSAPGKTTGDVATILEAKYGVMETFFERHGDEIADAMADSMLGALEGALSGAPVNMNPLASAEQDVKEMFQEFIDQKEMDGMVAGVPTMAARRGVSHRRRHPYKKGNPERPSFVDTGLYRENMTAWIEE